MQMDCIGIPFARRLLVPNGVIVRLGAPVPRRVPPGEGALRTGLRGPALKLQNPLSGYIPLDLLECILMPVGDCSHRL